MTKTPWHLWVVGVVSLVWNAGGAMDYAMTKLNVASYVAALPEAALRMLQDAPIWFDTSWAVGVWFSVLGSILLLLRSRFAAGAFALSLLGLIVSSIYTYVLAPPDASMLAVGGTVALVFAIAIPIILVLLLIYAQAMTRKGVLG